MGTWPDAETSREAPASDDYKLIDDTGKIVFRGTQGQVFAAVKHHVPDGRYQISGPDLTIDCERKNGVVGPVDDGVAVSIGRQWWM